MKERFKGGIQEVAEGMERARGNGEVFGVLRVKDLRLMTGGRMEARDASDVPSQTIHRGRIHSGVHKDGGQDS